MERPIGVTVLAVLYFFAAFSLVIALIPSPAFNPLQRPGFLALAVGNLVLRLILGIALLRMKSWSRWLAIIASVAHLLLALREIVVAQSSMVELRAGLGILFSVFGDLVSDSTAGKDGVPKRLIVCR